jgi:hypothetical protein
MSDSQVFSTWPLCTTPHDIRNQADWQLGKIYGSDKNLSSYTAFQNTWDQMDLASRCPNCVFDLGASWVLPRTDGIWITWLHIRFHVHGMWCQNAGVVLTFPSQLQLLSAQVTARGGIKRKIGTPTFINVRMRFCGSVKALVYRRPWAMGPWLDFHFMAIPHGSTLVRLAFPADLRCHTSLLSSCRTASRTSWWTHGASLSWMTSY